MILAAIVIAFLLDQVRSTGHEQTATCLLRRWIDTAAGYADAGTRQHACLAWALAVVVPTLTAGLAGWLCTRAAGWFGRLAWDVAVLYLTLGFRQCGHYYTAIRDALAAGDEAKARTLLAQWQGGEQAGQAAEPLLRGSGAGRGTLVRRAIEYAVLSAHRGVFGVLFWFSLCALLGFAPAGAVLYRCTDCVMRYWRHKAGQGSVSLPLLAVAQTAWSVIDWLPARLTALMFAFVGNFEDAIAAWRQRSGGAGDAADNAAGEEGNNAIVLAAAAGALGIHLVDDPAKSDVERHASDKSTDGSTDGSLGPTAATAGAAGVGFDARSPAPPDWAPAAPSDDDAASTRAMGTSASANAEPDLRHFVHVAGLLWRSVALWLLLLILLTFAHVLG